VQDGVQRRGAILECLLFSNKFHVHIDVFVNKQNTCTYESSHIFVETSFHPAKYTVWFAIGKYIIYFILTACFDSNTNTNVYLVELQILFLEYAW
jgi:hypothetical protein